MCNAVHIAVDVVISWLPSYGYLNRSIIWLIHNLVEASFDLFRYLLLGDQPMTSTGIIYELHECWPPQDYVTTITIPISSA